MVAKEESSRDNVRYVSIYISHSFQFQNNVFLMQLDHFLFNQQTELHSRELILKCEFVNQEDKVYTFIYSFMSNQGSKFDQNMQRGWTLEVMHLWNQHPYYPNNEILFFREIELMLWQQSSCWFFYLIFFHKFDVPCILVNTK